MLVLHPQHPISLLCGPRQRLCHKMEAEARGEAGTPVSAVSHRDRKKVSCRRFDGSASFLNRRLTACIGRIWSCAIGLVAFSRGSSADRGSGGGDGGGAIGGGVAGGGGQPWAAGQLGQGERRHPSKRNSPSLGGTVNIGAPGDKALKTGAPRKIDKVLSKYIQGICSNFRSETKEGCEGAGKTWFKCPEDFPHADSAVRGGVAHIPVCYTDSSYAERGWGPPKSWCVPSHLISFGPKIAEQINKGVGAVCERKFRKVIEEEKKAKDKWKARAESYKKTLDKDLDAVSQVDAKADQWSQRKQVQKVSNQLEAEKAKERKWKNLAQEYRQQVEEDKGSAEDAMKKLEDALKYMNTKGGGGGASSGKTSGTAQDNSLCDKTGCWEVDTADATTQDTIKKFKEAGRRAQSGGAGSAVADAQVAAASGQLAARNAAASLSGKPLQNTLQNTCSSPWKSSAASSACSGKPCVAGACSYVRQRCPQRSGLFNYLSLPYCTMPLMPGLALFLLVMWMVILSVWLALAADAFLCPNLSVISKECRMSDAVAGLTFLAFGNGAPDIFSMIAAAIASPKGAEMSLGEVMGSSLFVACVVMGIIAIGCSIQEGMLNFARQNLTTSLSGFFLALGVTTAPLAVSPFTLSAQDFVRDVVFFLASLVWLFYILLDSSIGWMESLGFVVVYIVYIAVVVSGTFTRRDKAFMAEAAAERSKEKGLLSVDPNALAAHRKNPPSARQESAIGALVRYISVGVGHEEVSKEPSGIASKILGGVRSPAMVVMRLSNPVVDMSKLDEGWCKPAALCQITLSPLLIIWSILLHGFPNLSSASTYIIFMVSLVVGGLLAASINATSRASSPPSYHRLLAFLGFIVSVAWIYALATELVHVLQAIGRIMGISDTLLGLTVLAFANSVGDLVANLAMARAGMPAMAAAACIGAPLLNLLLGLGSATLLGNVLVKEPFPLTLNLQLYTGMCFLIFSLIAMLVYSIANKMQAGAWFGIMLILIYNGFLFSCLGLEMWGGGKMLTSNIGPELRYINGAGLG